MPISTMIGPQTFTVLAGQDGVNAGAEVRDVYGTVTAVSTIGRIQEVQTSWHRGGGSTRQH